MGHFAIISINTHEVIYKGNIAQLFHHHKLNFHNWLMSVSFYVLVMLHTKIAILKVNNKNDHSNNNIHAYLSSLGK